MIEVTIYIIGGLIILFFLVLGFLFWVATKTKDDICNLCGSQITWFGSQWFCLNPKCERFSSPMVKQDQE